MGYKTVQRVGYRILVLISLRIVDTAFGCPELTPWVTRWYQRNQKQENWTYVCTDIFLDMHTYFCEAKFLKNSIEVEMKFRV